MPAPIRILTPEKCQGFMESRDIHNEVIEDLKNSFEIWITENIHSRTNLSGINLLINLQSYSTFDKFHIIPQFQFVFCF